MNDTAEFRFHQHLRLTVLPIFLAPFSKRHFYKRFFKYPTRKTGQIPCIIPDFFTQFTNLHTIIVRYHRHEVSN